MGLDERYKEINVEWRPWGWGGWVHCNVHNTNGGPRCPWCTAPALASYLSQKSCALVMVAAYIMGMGVSGGGGGGGGEAVSGSGVRRGGVRSGESCKSGDGVGVGGGVSDGGMMMGEKSGCGCDTSQDVGAGGGWWWWCRRGHSTRTATPRQGSSSSSGSRGCTACSNGADDRTETGAGARSGAGATGGLEGALIAAGDMLFLGTETGAGGRGAAGAAPGSGGAGGCSCATPIAAGDMLFLGGEYLCGACDVESTLETEPAQDGKVDAAEERGGDYPALALLHAARRCLLRLTPSAVSTAAPLVGRCRLPL